MVRGTNLKPSQILARAFGSRHRGVITFVAPAQAEERDGELTLLRGRRRTGDSAGSSPSQIITIVAGVHKILKRR